MKYVLILAGGIGRRMGFTEVPKQFLEIDDIPIIMYTIKQFYGVSGIDKIVVVIPDRYQEYFNKLVKKNNFTNVLNVVGGLTRYESVLKGSMFIYENLKNDDNTVIISHDAVRPFVGRQIIEDHMNLINFYSAVDTVIPVVDTIVEINGGSVVNILNKKNQLMSQTPQTYMLHEYLELCSNLTDEEKEKLTDVCDIYYLKNKQIGWSLGEASNFRIITPADLEIAKSLVYKKKNIFKA